jgi:LacI family transcriptional regulator
MAKKHKITIAEIAQELGVSTTLVSMVINGKADQHNINKKTQKRVWDKVNELNYKPNTVARSLRTGKTQSIGLIVADISNPFYAKLARIIEDQLREKGFHLIISSSDENPKHEENLILAMLEHQVDGMIIATTQSDKDQFTQLKRQNYPFVLIDRRIPDLQASYVGVNNYQAAYSLTQTFIQNGYSDVVYLSLTPDHLSTIREREKGYLDAIGNKEPLIKKVNFNNLCSDVENIIKAILQKGFKKPALFSSNNHVAKCCMNTIRDLNLKIPEDIGLASFDDIELFEFSSPPVTAIAQPIDKMGNLAACILIGQITGKQTAPQDHIFETKIVNRNSI